MSVKFDTRSCVCGSSYGHPEGRQGHVHYPVNGRHNRPLRIALWREGMVIWNFSTGLFDRVTLKINHPLQRGDVMSWSIDPTEDEETEWRSQSDGRHV